MDNLSIVIKDDSQENISNSIKVLTPLLEDEDTQLIIINRINNNFYTENNHIIYEFEEDYKNFYKFCSASSFNNNLMIIEDCLILTEELIREIKRLLIKYKDINIKVNVKRYYDKDNYYITEAIIINNDKSQIEEKINILVDSFSYLNNTGINLKHNIQRFIQDEKFEELYLWYKNYIVKEEGLKNRFYDYLEKNKIEIEDNLRKEIDKRFILEELDLKYCEYLKLIKRLRENKLTEDYIKNVTQKVDFNVNDTYFRYFIIECFKRKNFINYLFNIISNTIMAEYMKMLFDEYDYFYLNVFEFLNSIKIERQLNDPLDEGILVYMKIIEIYCENMSSNSVIMDKKEKIIQLFKNYLKYGIYILNNNFEISNQKKEFLTKLKQASNLINLKKIKEAIIILRDTAEIYEPMTMAIRYYLQKLIRDYNTFKCKLSICIMAKNEEKYLDKCLKSIKPLMDSGIAELIFVDTGSTDRTIEIASKYTNNLYRKPWQGNFSEMRNYCISLAQGEYLFIPDADEELDNNDIKKLIKLFSGEDYKKYCTYTLKEKNYENNELNKYSMIIRTFIFKNEETFHFSGTVHNQPNFKQPVNNLDVMVFHYGYIMNSKEIKERKFNRTGYILKKELEKDPLNLYYRYQLAKSYSVYGDHKESLNQVKLFMKVLNKFPLNYDHIMYYIAAAVVYFCNRLYKETIKVCDDILSIMPDFMDALYFKAQSLFLLNQYLESISYYKHYLNSLNSIYNNPVINDTRLEFYSLDSKEIAEKDIMAAYLNIQDYEGYINYVLAKEKFEVVKYQFGIINCYIALNQFKELAMFYTSYIACGTKNDKLDFIYFIKNEILSLEDYKLEILLNEFNKLNLDEEYFYLLIHSIDKRNENSFKDIIRFLSKQDMVNFNIMILEKSIYNFIIALLNDKDTDLKLNQIVDMRRIIKNVLIQILNKKSIEGLNDKQILKLISKYVDYSFLLYENRKQSLNDKEILFLNHILLAFQHLQNKDLISAVKSIKNAALEDEDMANAMAIYVESIAAI